jgi:hypothetical protein
MTLMGPIVDFLVLRSHGVGTAICICMARRWKGSYHQHIDHKHQDMPSQGLSLRRHTPTLDPRRTNSPQAERAFGLWLQPPVT